MLIVEYRCWLTSRNIKNHQLVASKDDGVSKVASKVAFFDLILVDSKGETPAAKELAGLNNWSSDEEKAAEQAEARTPLNLGGLT